MKITRPNPIVLIAALVLACNGQPAASTGPGSSAGAATPGGTTAGSTAPITLPPASLTDPAEIGQAFADPARVDVAVASALALLGIGIYGADGQALRAGTEKGADDLWLTAAEVIGLIEMQRQDLAAIAEKDPEAPTLGDLTEALASVIPGIDTEAVLAAYEAAYATGGGVVGAIVKGLKWDAATRVTRGQLWFVYVDGYALAGGSAAGSGPFAAIGGGVPPPPAQTAIAGLPSLPSRAGNPGSFAILLAHLQLLGFAIPFTIDPTSSSAHEGHGAAAPSVIWNATQGAASMPTPFGGQPMVQASGRLDGLTVHWLPRGPMTAHGDFAPGISTLTTTDAGGVVTMSYTPKAEPANGQGTEFHAQGGVKAYANVADLVSSQFVITPELRSWLIGTRSAVSNVQLGWHETMKLVLDIESEFKITKYNQQPVGNGITEVSGRIELTHNEDGSWTGNGFLDGTTTSDSPSCNTLAFSPRGSAHYDWKVRIEDRGPQDPGSFDVWMDAGPIVEGDATGPDPFVVTVCPPGFTLTGAVVAWENLYFGMHQDMFNDYGLYTVIDPFPAAATAPPGAFGKVLASSTYEWDCSDADNPTTAKLVSCTEKTTLRLEGYQP